MRRFISILMILLMAFQVLGWGFSKGIISGKVVDKDSPKIGVSGVIIRVEGRDEVWITDKNGKFNISELEKKIYTLTFSKEDIIKTDIEIKVDLMKKNKENLKDIPIDLYATIKGKIVDGEKLSPIQEVNVEIRKVITQENKGTITTIELSEKIESSKKDGVFKHSWISEGDYRLYFEHPQYLPVKAKKPLGIITNKIYNITSEKSSSIELTRIPEETKTQGTGMYETTLIKKVAMGVIDVRGEVEE